MELSPEERDRIFQEEKARREAQKRLAHDEKTRKMGWPIIVGALLGVVLLFLTQTHESSPTGGTDQQKTAATIYETYASKTSNENTAAVGKVTSMSRSETCAPTAEALTRILGSTSKDEGLRRAGVEARSAGWVGPVFLGPPDRVKILEKSGDQIRVRIVDSGAGEYDDNQKVCWIPRWAISR